MSKGSRQRPVDPDRYSTNWDKIFGKKVTFADIEMFCGVCDEPIPHDKFHTCGGLTPKSK